MSEYQKGSKKLINAWAFYDWANSVYSLVISTAIFPIYYNSVAGDLPTQDGKIEFLGTLWNSSSLLSYTISFYMLIVAFISPILSGIADYSGKKLSFLKFFCFLGSFSVIMLCFFDAENFWIGILFTILAGIGFWGSIVFYNAYLPEIAHPDQQDSVSAKGFMMGYIGSVLLLLVSLVLSLFPEIFGLKDAAVAAKVTFVLVGLWWIGFAQITYKRLSKLPTETKKITKSILFNGFNELKGVLNQLQNHQQLKYFLISFFFISLATQTIIYMASLFGSDELGLGQFELILTILAVQIVAIAGALIFSKLSKKIGNLKALKATIVIWCLVCFCAFLIHKEQEYVTYYFYGLGGLLGLVLGAIQSLARSTYSKLLPKTDDTATYFSFYDVTEKIAIVCGTIIFGVLISLTGSMQWSVLSLGLSFVVAFLIINKIKKTKHVF